MQVSEFVFGCENENENENDFKMMISFLVEVVLGRMGLDLWPGAS